VVSTQQGTPAMYPFRSGMVVSYPFSVVAEDCTTLNRPPCVHFLVILAGDIEGNLATSARARTAASGMLTAGTRSLRHPCSVITVLYLYAQG
jgi:hypothetical protein